MDARHSSLWLTAQAHLQWETFSEPSNLSLVVGDASEFGKYLMLIWRGDGRRSAMAFRNSSPALTLLCGI